MRPIDDGSLASADRNVGKAHHIHEVVNGRFYYPREPGSYAVLCKEWPTF